MNNTRRQNNNRQQYENIHKRITNRANNNVKRHEKRLSRGHLWGTRKLSEKNKKNLKETHEIAERVAFEDLPNEDKFLYEKYRYRGKYANKTLLNYLNEKRKNLQFYINLERNPYNWRKFTKEEIKKMEEEEEKAKDKNRRALKEIEDKIKKLEDKKTRRELFPNWYRHIENID